MNLTAFSASTVRRNYPGFDYPLEFCPMLKKHKPEVIRAVWKSHKDLRGFIGWAKYARSWNGQTISRFVDDHINDPLPISSSTAMVRATGVKVTLITGIFLCYFVRNLFALTVASE